jgi:hypothetical protein
MIYELSCISLAQTLSEINFISQILTTLAFSSSIHRDCIAATFALPGRPLTKATAAFEY